jgi:2-amino-4-hydroxy-6-hydroxymethyldihydropteridine diphosphokinase
MPNTAYLSLGSNIDPEINIEAAIRMLSDMTQLVAVSSVWETKPVGFMEQPSFLNAAIIVKTELNAQQLKQCVLDMIEQELGRVRQADKNGPRTIDIDIMLFNQQVLRYGRRRVPDAELLNRAFVAIPMAEISPDYEHPETGQTLHEIAQRFKINPNEMRLHPTLSSKLARLHY